MPRFWREMGPTARFESSGTPESLFAEKALERGPESDSACAASRFNPNAKRPEVARPRASYANRDGTAVEFAAAALF